MLYCSFHLVLILLVNTNVLDVQIQFQIFLLVLVQTCVLGSHNWKNVIDDEATEAVSQGVDVLNEGFCVVLKKNGKVGQRTKGINLQTLLGNVVARREAGMDVTNI